MSITSMIGELFRPVSNIVDELHTSEEEKFKIKKEMAKLESNVQIRMLDVEKQMVQAKSSIVNAEANIDRGCNLIGGPLPCSPFYLWLFAIRLVF